MALKNALFSLLIACLLNHSFTAPGWTKSPPAEAPVEWCKIVSKATCSPRLIQGSDNLWNLVYEIVTTNFSASDLNIEKLQVFNKKNGEKPILSLSGELLKAKINCIAKPNSRTNLKPGESAIIWINISFTKKPSNLKSLEHEITFSQKDKPFKDSFSLAVDEKEPIVIGPPLKGKHWVAMGGYNGILGHRKALMPIGNNLVLSQRYAIDWIQFDKNWNSWHGSWKNEKNSVCYGKPVLAVSDGTVVGVIDKFKDQPPFIEAKDLAYPGGNCITLDIGNGLYAFYAHIKPGGMKVKQGQVVKKGQIIGFIGNSGHSFEPHLHFHITDKPEILKGDGIPYVFENFVLTGTAENLKRYATNKPRSMPAPIKLLPEKVLKTNQIPKEGAIVDFTGRD